QAPQRRPWGGMLGGLAAGLGLAWLAHSLGMGGAFGSVLMIGLLVLLGVVVIGLVARSRRGAGQGYAYQGAPADVAAPPRQYNPDKVGNDASARPWERNTTAFDANPAGTGSQSGVRIGSALQGGGSALEGSQNWGVPPGFDTEGFVAAAKRNFVTLQDAWDRTDLATLRSMMTDEMLAEIRGQLAERDRQQSGQGNRTEVVMLEAQLLGIEDLGDAYMASVEFSGMIREEPSAGPSPFREVWNMTKPKSGNGGWVVAGLQALQ
ncbi:Tim44-like domain-containing protein, partial [Ramlibacter sp.]|uniref:Tim44 domain-containing protein n=1 Tax=Ramlibacter sp. TaxID=1917967 RepID=UPI00180E8FD4